MKTMKNILSVISCLLLCVQTFGQTWNIGSPVATDVIATLEDSTLTISGTGAMMEVSQNGGPWGSYSQIAQVIIQDGVTDISYSAFRSYPGYNNLISVEISESVKRVGENAFNNTLLYDSQPDGLVYIDKWLYKYKGIIPDETKINIPEGTLGIADGAFSFQTNLTSVSIPANVTNIGEKTFFNCSRLVSIILNNTIPPEVQSYAFSNVPIRNCMLYVPTSSKAEYEKSDVWGKFEIVELPDISEEDIDFTPTTDGATIEWPPYENAEGYKLIIYSDEAQTDTIYIFEFDATGNLFNTISFRSASTTLSHTIEKLQNDTDYFYTLEILGVGDVVLTSLSDKFTTGNQPTSIDVPLTEAIESRIVGYYSIVGVKLPEEPSKGMYIILYSNGRVEKILK